ncbi:VOC family protein [Alkalihalobacillus pseudalcaliphilus]|uniref:VOC family protein n=1 Tax=Alkalihalobacillus pseudalcaliphilus TaxID=79884 RepID=UPI00064D8BB8|nr:VOC family protein [Alkalihalobacillus pseudalcaliphilus]KMK75624.1 glyoxalase [Alkalihalobacillus pseudalcaliphilus]
MTIDKKSVNPVLNEVGTIFIPVRDIEKARDWYCDLFGLPIDGEILHEHLYVIPTEGTGIVLDSKIFNEENVYKSPPFHLNTHDIYQAYEYIKTKKLTSLSEIQHGQWFNFKDPDGNHLMICKC